MAALASLAPLGHLEARQSRRSTTAGSAFYLDGPHCSASPAGFSRAISLSIALLSSPGAGLILMLLMPHAPAQHPHPLLRGYRVHTLICRGSGLPRFFLLSPANVHDAPFAQPLLAWAVHLYRIRLRVIRLDAAYWGLRLIAWIHGVLGAVAVIPWNPKRAA